MKKLLVCAALVLFPSLSMASDPDSATPECKEAVIGVVLASAAKVYVLDNFMEQNYKALWVLAQNNEPARFSNFGSDSIPADAVDQALMKVVLQGPECQKHLRDAMSEALKIAKGMKH